MIECLRDAVGGENLGELWLLAYETFGPKFSEEDALLLAPVARRQSHPRNCSNIPCLYVRPDHIYENDSGGYSLIPKDPESIS